MTLKLIAVIALIMTVVLTLASTNDAVAQTEPPAQTRTAFVGTVLSYEGSVLTLDLAPRRDPGQIEVSITDDTKVVSAAEPSVAGVQDMLEPDARVTVLAASTDDVWEAQYVVVKPATPPVPPATGLVTEVEGDLITILLPNGATRQYRLPEGETPPAEGEMVTVFARLRTGASSEEPPEITGLQTMTQVQERLQAHLDRLAGETDLTPDRLRIRDRIIEHISTRLEQHVTVQLQVMERLHQNPNVPQATKDRLQDWLQDREQVRDRIMQGVENARGEAGAGSRGPGRNN
jgi:hypothetical protein